MTLNGNKKISCVILFSGGTDSMCVSALKAKEYLTIHLLTYFSEKNERNNNVTNNVELLKKRYPKVNFQHHYICVNKLVLFLSYNKYFKYIFKFKFLVLSTPGFTSLSWHWRTILFCKKNNCTDVFDGVTKELTHFPGHMDRVIQTFKEFYRQFEISFENPVRHWEVPQNQQFVDRLIVDQHGYIFPSEQSFSNQKKTTGQYLCDEKLFDHPNIKGSPQDRKMQQDCYPFILYNIMAFWFYLNIYSYEEFCIKTNHLIQEKIKDIIPIIQKKLVDQKLLEDPLE